MSLSLEPKLHLEIRGFDSWNNLPFILFKLDDPVVRHGLQRPGEIAGGSPRQLFKFPQRLGMLVYNQLQ